MIITFGHVHNHLQTVPVTLRAQKRKRAGLGAKCRPDVESGGRARSKFTGVYQQSRGSGWFASICIDKSVRDMSPYHLNFQPR